MIAKNINKKLSPAERNILRQYAKHFHLPFNTRAILGHLIGHTATKYTDKNTIGQTGGPQNVEISESTVGGAARHGGS